MEASIVSDRLNKMGAGSGSNFQTGKGDVQYLNGDMKFSLGGKFAENHEATFGKPNVGCKCGSKGWVYDVKRQCLKCMNCGEYEQQDPSDDIPPSGNQNEPCK